MDKKIEYRYEYANGDVVVLTAEGGAADRTHQISEEWIRILEELDRIDYNSNQTETRRHCSLDAYDPDEYYLAAVHDGFDELECAEIWELMKEKLTEREQLIAERYFIKGYKPKEIAEIFGITPRRVQQIVRTIQKKLKNFSK